MAEGIPLQKALLIAEQANPEWVSVPLVGWSLASAIARQVPALIVTHVRNREAILRTGFREGLDFVCIDNESIAAPLHRLAQILRGGQGKGWTAVTALESLSYYAFELQVWKVFGSRIRNREFGVVHRITPLSPTAPSILARRCARIGVPFIVGPLNGGLPWPPGFSDRRIAEREWLSYVRGLYRLMPGYRSMRRHSQVMLVASQATLDQMPKRYRYKCRYLAENGVPAEAIEAAPTRTPPSLPLRALFVGRFVPYKCPDIVLHASRTLITQNRLLLTFVGGGPLEDELKRLSRELSIDHRVRFAGWLERREVLDEMSRADFLVLPSIREFGGGVVLEAMARGLPSVVADYGGPAELVDDDTGVKIPFTDSESLTNNLSAALERLAADPAALERMSEACASKAAREFTWDSKAAKIAKIYSELHQAT